MKPEELYRSPNRLARDYKRFDVTNRILLTGHSHQAWPDCGFEAQSQAWLDAAALVDDKWDLAFGKADRVRRGFATLLDDTSGHIALAGNTHELLVRFLSALPLQSKRRLLTTDGEFHTIRRQLDRLAEEPIEVAKVRKQPSSTVVQRLMDAVDDRTAAVLVSAVFFENAEIVRGLGELQRTCDAVGVPLLVDAYHALNAMPFSLRDTGLETAFVIGGGYKYCQLGEGNCFLRVPRDCEMRPVVTGWFSEFEILAPATLRSKVEYGSGSARFAGATYDPTSHYRAAAVFDFFEQRKLTPTLLREISQHQIGLLAREFDNLDADPQLISRDQSVDLRDVGGFLALRSPHAKDLVSQLRERMVYADYRGDVFRLGPAPYLSDDQLTAGVQALGEVVAGWNLRARQEAG